MQGIGKSVYEMVYADIERKYSDWSAGAYWDRANGQLHKHRQNPGTGLCSGKCRHCRTGHKGEVLAAA